MKRARRSAIVGHMSKQDPINALLLQEFRLRETDDTGEVARIVASSPPGIEPVVPLLTSIEDQHDVATVRAIHESESPEEDSQQRAALEPLVESWQRLREYEPRMTERSGRASSHYRLAVTESGINNAESAGPSPVSLSPDRDEAPMSAGLLWIGAPLDTYAGLLVLLGTYANREEHRQDWPSAAGRRLGVRIYESD